MHLLLVTALLLGVCAVPAMAKGPKDPRPLPFPRFTDTPQDRGWAERGTGTYTAFMHGYGEAANGHEKGYAKNNTHASGVHDSQQDAFVYYVGYPSAP